MRNESARPNSIGHFVRQPALVALIVLFSQGLCSSRTNALENFPPFLLQWGSYGTGDGQFSHPYAIATGPQGYVYVSDQNIQRIQVFTGAGAFVTKWGSNGTTPGKFTSINGIGVSSVGDVYVTSSDRLQRFTASGAFVQQWGAYGKAPGQFRSAMGIALDSNGQIYVADLENDRIQKFTADGAFLMAWGTAGTGPGQFGAPYSIAIDRFDNIYVGDIGNYRIQKFRPDSTFVVQWSGTLADSTAYYGFGLAADPYGHLYAPSWGYYRINVWDSVGTFRYQWGRLGAGPGEFNRLIGVAIDKDLNLYAVDRENNRIQKFYIGGVVSADESEPPHELAVRVIGTPVIRGRARVEVVGVPGASVRAEFFDIRGRRLQRIAGITDGTGHWSALWPPSLGSAGVQFVRVQQLNSFAVAKAVLTQ